MRKASLITVSFCIVLCVLFTIHSIAQEQPNVSPAPTDAQTPVAAPAENEELPNTAANAAASSDMASEQMDNPVRLEANVKDVFPKLEWHTDDHGHPIPQTIHLNEKVSEKEGERYSGFWFVVDRSEAAQKEGYTQWKGKLAMYLYFLPPKAMKTWGMDRVNGEMGGQWSFNTLKLWRFKPQLRNLPPKDKDRLIVQTVAAHELKEGKEYYLQFGFSLEYKEPVDMTICLGYRKTIWNYKQWNGFNEAIDFLGLEHKGKVGKADEFHR